MHVSTFAGLIDWERFDDAFGAYYHNQNGRCRLRARLMAGLHLLKHVKLSDEELCAAWLENPYDQAFCSERHFRHWLPFDRSYLTRWRTASSATVSTSRSATREAWNMTAPDHTLTASKKSLHRKGYPNIHTD